MWTSQRDFFSLSLPSLMLTINNQRFCYSKSLTGCKIQTDVWWQESTCENNITVAGPKISEFCVKTTWRIKSQNQDIHPMYTAQKIGTNNWPKEMRIMSATHVDTCTNALKNTRDLPSVNTSEINAGKNLGTFLLDSRSYRSARANLTPLFMRCFL